MDKNVSYCVQILIHSNEIRTKDFFKDISEDFAENFFNQTIRKKHASGILTGSSKKVLGFFKDEAGEKIIQSFVGL